MSSVELLIKTSIRQLDIVKDIFQLDSLYFHMAHLVSRQAKVSSTAQHCTAQHSTAQPSSHCLTRVISLHSMMMSR